MNKTIGLQLVIYSLLLAGLSYVVYHLAPTLAKPTLIVGLTGGLLCLVWGLRVVTGSRGKALLLLTLIPVNFVLLAQTVIGWSGASEGIPGRHTAAALITVLFALSIGILMRIVYAGARFDGQSATPPKDGGAKPQKTGKLAT